MMGDFMGPPKDTEYTPSSELSIEDNKIMAGRYSYEQIKMLVNDLWRYPVSFIVSLSTSCLHVVFNLLMDMQQRSGVVRKEKHYISQS
jgi:hypothetical protein